MGYSMSQTDQTFFIPHSRIPAMLASVQDLHGSESILDSSGRHFAWVDEDFYTIDDPIEILSAWRWEAVLDERGNINSIQFAGEKLGDCHILFDAIAPYVKKGSYIEMSGEDGERWRWLFDGAKMVEKQAKLDWS